MSNHAARAHAEAGVKWGKVFVCVFACAVVLTLVVAPWIYHRWSLPDDAWPAYDAQVLETRVVRVGVLESQSGTGALLRVEVLAVWTEDGQRREAWVPTTKTGGDNTYLALWASQKGKRCTVRVAPRNPEERLAFFP